MIQLKDLSSRHPSPQAILSTLSCVRHSPNSIQLPYYTCNTLFFFIYLKYSKLPQSGDSISPISVFSGPNAVRGASSPLAHVILTMFLVLHKYELELSHQPCTHIHFTAEETVAACNKIQHQIEASEPVLPDHISSPVELCYCHSGMPPTSLLSSSQHIP